MIYWKRLLRKGSARMDSEGEKSVGGETVSDEPD